MTRKERKELEDAGLIYPSVDVVRKDPLSDKHVSIIERVLSEAFPSLIITVNATYDPINFRYIIYVNVKDIFAIFTPSYFTVPVFVIETMEFNIDTINKIVEEATKGIEETRGVYRK